MGAISTRGRLGPVLLRLRTAQALTQAELAERAGIDQSTVSKLERGARPNPGAAVLAALARGLGCTMDELVNADDPTPAQKGDG